MHADKTVLSKIIDLNTKCSALENLCNKRYKCSQDVLQEIHYIHIRLVHLTNRLASSSAKKPPLDDRELFQ
jgi:hypothetical protein